MMLIELLDELNVIIIPLRALNIIAWRLLRLSMEG
jgi:hypothetical protein